MIADQRPLISGHGHLASERSLCHHLAYNLAFQADYGRGHMAIVLLLLLLLLSGGLTLRYKQVG